MSCLLGVSDLSHDVSVRCYTPLGGSSPAVLSASAQLTQHTFILTENTTKKENVEVVAILWAEILGGGRIEQAHAILAVCIDLFDTSDFNIQYLTLLKLLKVLR